MNDSLQHLSSQKHHSNNLVLLIASWLNTLIDSTLIPKSSMKLYEGTFNDFLLNLFEWHLTVFYFCKHHFNNLVLLDSVLIIFFDWFFFDSGICDGEESLGGRLNLAQLEVDPRPIEDLEWRRKGNKVIIRLIKTERETESIFKSNIKKQKISFMSSFLIHVKGRQTDTQTDRQADRQKKPLEDL